MQNYIKDVMKLYKYDYTEIPFNIEDVCFTVYSFHHRDNSPLFNEELKKDMVQHNNNSKGILHHHPFYEIFFTHNGDFEVALDNGSLYPGKDDLIIMSPGTNHFAMEKGEGRAIYLNVNFEKNNCKTENKLYDLLADVFSAPYLHIKKSPKFYNLLQNFLSSVDIGNTFMLARYFYEFIIEILKETNHLTTLSPDEMLRDSSMSRYRKISYLLGFFNSENISIEFIANSLNLSQRQTARIIKEIFGCTLSEIIQRKRMLQAEKYLENKKMTIAEISAMVGYNSINCFYNAFKKKHGCLPSEYRKNFNIKNIEKR